MRSGTFSFSLWDNLVFCSRNITVPWKLELSLIKMHLQILLTYVKYEISFSDFSLNNYGHRLFHVFVIVPGFYALCSTDAPRVQKSCQNGREKFVKMADICQIGRSANLTNVHRRRSTFRPS